jgi:hypothetical protein
MRRILAIGLLLLVVVTITNAPGAQADGDFEVDVARSRALRVGDYLNYTVRVDLANETYCVLVVKNATLDEVFRDSFLVNGSRSGEFYLDEEFGSGFYYLEIYGVGAMSPNATAKVHIQMSLGQEIAAANAVLLDRFNSTLAYNVLEFNRVRDEVAVLASDAKGFLNSIWSLLLWVVVAGVIAAGITTLICIAVFRPAWYLNGERVGSSKVVKTFTRALPQFVVTRKADKIIDEQLAEGERVATALKQREGGLTQLDKAYRRVRLSLE